VRILWHSQAPWYPGSFGVQTALFAPRIAAGGHDVAISAAVGLQGTPQHWNGLLVYDASGTKLGGWKEIPRNARLHFRDKPGLVVTLADAWSAASELLGLRVASFVPVENDPLPERIRTHLLLSGATPLAVTRNGEELLRAAGLEPLFVPHGVDTTP
jgi:hypothetical protein